MKKGMTMTSTMILVIFSLVFGVVLVTVALFMGIYQQSMVQSVQTSSRQAVEQVSNTVSEYVKDMNEVMTMVEEIRKIDQTDRDSFASAFLRTRPDVMAVTTYDKDGQLEECWATGHELREDIGQNLSFDWYDREAETPDFLSSPHVESIFQGWYPWVVTMAGPVEMDGEQGWVALDLSFENISSYINEVGIGQHGYCFLMDHDGGIIYHPQQQLIYSQLKQEDTTELVHRQDGAFSQDSKIYAIRSVEGCDWRVVGVSYVEELITANVAQMGRLLWIIGLVILVTALISGIVLSRAIARPLRGLSGAMHQFETQADTFTYVPVGGAREVRELSNSFGHMVGKIQDLMETVRQEEVNLRKTELRALQAQINPHFLYNTLDSIAWMCERGKNADAVQMVNALARLFRISISRGHELIPIRAEMQHAESYLQIQKHRYQNQFTYQFDVDESCLECLCNKITLQPIIENAIYHGINGLVDEGEIVITIRPEEEDIVMTVSDNGVGMEQEQIEAILQKERSDHAGIGIKNVNDRLKIYFGERYGITIDSEPDEGTTVTIRMPQVREETAYEHR